MSSFSFHTIEAEDLFRRFASGDEAALGLLYKRFYGPLIHYGCRKLDDEFEVATIVQEAFVRLWELRGRMVSLLHAYRFLRLVIRWGCADYYRQPASRFRRRCLVYPENIEWYPAVSDLAHQRQQKVAEEQVQLVYKVIPYLPPTRRTMLQLHFAYGFSCKQIAGRFRSSSSAISVELQKSLDYLRQVIHATQRKARAEKREVPAGMDAAGISEMQRQVYVLRCQEKKEFAQIAALLHLPQAEVQQVYVQTCLQLRREGRASVPAAASFTPQPASR